MNSSDPGSLINIGELAKPAVVLIERISDAVGGIFRPRQIRRVAQAEADAAIIKAKGDIQISELRERTVDRLVHEEEIRQRNIERIAAMAIRDLSEDAKPEELDSDWLTHFFDRGRLISDRQMQELWSRLLAEQANKPGAFSRRTVELLYMMERPDARVFEQLCRFRWLFGINNLVPLVLNIDPDDLSASTVYTDADVTFDTLTHLDSIGLVNCADLSAFSLAFSSADLVTFHWSDKAMVSLDLRVNQSVGGSTSLDVGHVLFTKAGEQIASLVVSEPVAGFRDYVIGIWEEAGFKPKVHESTLVPPGAPDGL